MLKWIAFAVASLIWIGMCWFFGGMVALTDSAPKGSIAQNDCAYRAIADAKAQGHTLDIMDARFSPKCMAIYRKTSAVAAAPAERTGLLIGVLPVIAIGLLMGLAERRRLRK